MLVSEMVEIVSTATTKEEAFARARGYAAQHPEFNFIMNLNAGKRVFPGIRRDTDFVLKSKDMTENGKNLGWFWKTKSAFEFLLLDKTAPGFNIQKKYDVLRRMANSIPYKEWTLLRTAMRGELLTPDEDSYGKVVTSLESDKYRGILAIMTDVQPDVNLEEVVQVKTVPTDNLFPPSKETEDKSLIVPNEAVNTKEETAPAVKKGRGRPKKVQA